MKVNTRWVQVLVIGLLLLILPTVVSLLGEERAQPAADTAARYTPPAIATPALAATPIPTATPMRIGGGGALPTAELPRGPVVVDLAHFSLVERSKFQPLAAALAPHGLDVRFWLPTVDPSEIEQITDFPDLSAELEKQLAGASALVVVSPFFLYTPAEVAVVQRFVADGGRLLLISDPDVESDAASDTNQLATAFNIIFNQDYLYDTAANDENFTYFFQGEFRNDARMLAGSRIAFYGGRSIDGAVQPLVRSADTTLSSLRSGLTSFNTVVLGGAEANGSQGRVLAMSDFDVLTDPYVARHDNRRMLEFVSDFLADAARDNGMTDFPNFLGKEVALALDNTQPVGALALGKAAELQRVLEASGRELLLAASDALSGTQPGPDLIYVAGYAALQKRPELLEDFDLRLVEEVVTPTVSAPSVTASGVLTPTATPDADALPPDGVAPGHKGTPVAPVAPPEVPPLGTPLAPETTPETTPEATPEATPETTPGPSATAAETPLPTPVTDGEGRAALPVQVETPGVTGTAAATGMATSAATESVVATSEPAATPTAATPTDATPTAAAPTAAAPATATPTAGGADSVEAGLAVTDALTATVEPTVTPAPSPTPTPYIRLLIERGDGLRLVADETLLYVRRSQAGGNQLLAVVGNSEQALSAALTRLLNRDFGGCLVQSDLILCPYSSGTPGTTTGGAPVAGASGAAGTPAVTATPGGTPGPSTPAAPQDAAKVLIVDDNAGVDAGEPSEAAIYLTTLTTAGYSPDLWVVSEQGMPAGSDLIAHEWVIWSDAGYTESAIDSDNLRVVGEYINQGGRLTISSRMPFFGVSANEPTPILDIQVADEIPELVKGLPAGPIALTSESPALNPLEENPDPGAGARTGLQRGPASPDAGAPVLILMTDAGFDEPKGARLLLFGLSMGWLPANVSDQLIRNMAELMLAE